VYPTNGNNASATGSFIGQGYYNCICSSGTYSAILGGFTSTNNGACSFIGGGFCNQHICNGGSGGSFVGGGLCNCTSGAFYSSITGGVNNQINGCSSSYNGIMGGCNNTMASYPSLRFTGAWNINNSCNNSYHSYYVSKSSSTFKINHPDPSKTDTHFLIHSSVESPTRGENLYRYEFNTQNCTASIELPDYFKHLNEKEQVWVKPKNNLGNGYGIVDETQSCVTFTTDTEGEFIAVILGTRKDWHACNMWAGVERYNTGEGESQTFIG